jgi:hypothetical protein
MLSECGIRISFLFSHEDIVPTFRAKRNVGISFSHGKYDGRFEVISCLMVIFKVLLIVHFLMRCKGRWVVGKLNHQEKIIIRRFIQ